jgi:hypothetical protein
VIKGGTTTKKKPIITAKNIQTVEQHHHALTLYAETI